MSVAILLGSYKMGLDVPVLASPRLRHNAEKPPIAPRPKGTTGKSHSHVVAPNRWYMTDLVSF